MSALGRYSNAPSQGICAFLAWFLLHEFVWFQSGLFGHDLETIILNQPPSVRVPRASRYKTTQQRLQAAVRVIPIQTSSSVWLYLERVSSNRCRGYLVPNRRQHIGAPSIKQFSVGMEMHTLDGIVGGGRRQMEFVDELALGHWRWPVGTRGSYS